MISWEYIAGFFDGEGSLVREQRRFVISIPQTNEYVLNEIARFTGVGIVNHIKKRKSHWKEAWVYRVGKRDDVLLFLKNMKDCLIIKRKLVEEAIPVIEQFSIECRERDSYFSQRSLMISQLFREGKTLTEIQDLIGIHRSAVRKTLISRGEYK